MTNQKSGNEKNYDCSIADSAQVKTIASERLFLEKKSNESFRHENASNLTHDFFMAIFNKKIW